MCGHSMNSQPMYKTRMSNFNWNQNVWPIFSLNFFPHSRMKEEHIWGYLRVPSLYPFILNIFFYSYSSISAMRGSPTFVLFLLLCSLVVLAYTIICLVVLNLILVSGHISDRAGSLQSGCPLYLKIHILREGWAIP